MSVSRTSLISFISKDACVGEQVVNFSIKSSTAFSMAETCALLAQKATDARHAVFSLFVWNLSGTIKQVSIQMMARPLVGITVVNPLDLSFSSRCGDGLIHGMTSEHRLLLLKRVQIRLTSHSVTAP